MSDFFDYAERNGLVLFPCAAGTKRPILPWKALSLGRALACIRLGKLQRVSIAPGYRQRSARMHA
jgi:hypothetical protein